MVQYSSAADLLTDEDEDVQALFDAQSGWAPLCLFQFWTRWQDHNEDFTWDKECGVFTTPPRRKAGGKGSVFLEELAIASKKTGELFFLPISMFDQ
jgi:hypothetical protein